MKTIGASRWADTDNIGDLASSPLLYFEYPNATKHEIKSSIGGPLPTDADLYIFGGGAITTKVHGGLGSLPGYKVGWGIGQSIKSGNKRAYQSPLVLGDRWGERYLSLLGSRDDGVKDSYWVPCASCMSPAFDEKYSITRDMGVYLNSTQERNDPNVMINRHSLAETIEFLGSSRVVLTDSYHGAYWTTLLGRTAVCINAYSSKFYQYRHQPVVVPDVRNQMQGPRVFPEALAECREANIQFDQKVRELLYG